ncbi:MAG TPA: hypothetical protein VFS24_11335 [Steroidobacteraceae bacterium]|nr:hypothetical protein [Steroidobacteraceae bacterium]
MGPATYSRFLLKLTALAVRLVDRTNWEWAAPLGAGVELRLAAQVQARTQQLAAAKGQCKNVLVSTHDLNLSAARKPMQAAKCEPPYNTPHIRHAR